MIMRKWMAAACAALCTAAPVTQAASFEPAVEPAVLMKMDFGGTQRAELGLSLRLNYPQDVRQSLGLMAAQPDTARDAMLLRADSRLATGPALAQFDFTRNGFHRASLAGLPLVTRHVRSQDEGEVAAEGDVPAEDAAWYDYGSWGWMGWTLAAAGVVGVYLLVDDDDEESAQAGGGGSEEPPADDCIIPGGPLGCIF
jgi:hypothetical protein